MTGVASGDRPVSGQIRGRVTMATEAEVVKARLGAGPKVRAAAAMTADARALAAPIHEVVMTLGASHRAVLVVRKVQNQSLAAEHERFAQSQARSRVQQCRQRGE